MIGITSSSKTLSGQHLWQVNVQAVKAVVVVIGVPVRVKADTKGSVSLVTNLAYLVMELESASLVAAKASVELTMMTFSVSGVVPFLIA